MGRAFSAGDVWRGVLTSCHQLEVHLQRSYRYYPVDLSIDKVVGDEVTATFVTHGDHSFYELKGVYEEERRRLVLRPERGKLSEAWEPCDAEAYVSPDFSTLSGVSLCEAHGECDPGGGEFMLRQERTEFVVEGAGDETVNGPYVSKGSYSEGGARVYDGAPLYVQRHCGDPCFAIVHEVIGQYGFWRIQHLDRIGNDAVVLYSVCSEDVYPPTVGWRPIHADDAPPPLLRPVVASMYDLKNMKMIHAPDPDADSRAASIGLLVAMGACIWLLVFFCGHSRLAKTHHRRPSPPHQLEAPP